MVGVSYAYPWDALLTRFKFHQALELAPVLAEVLGDVVLHARILESQGQPDLVLPVPLSPQRLRERGYNQAWALARRVAARLNRPARADVLERLRDTAHQTVLSRAERERNLRHAFVVPREHAVALQGRRVALVDDVVTTGATASAAAQALRAAGQQREDDHRHRRVHQCSQSASSGGRGSRPSMRSGFSSRTSCSGSSRLSLRRRGR